MAVHFHSLKIKNIRRETSDCVSVSFEVPEDLAEQFLYREGQNITIRKSINGEDLRRSYSICAAPHESELKVAIKKVDGGLFSSFANEHLQAGDTLEVMPPSGKFNVKASADIKGNYLAIAAGSGITPVISIIKHVLKSNNDSSFTLIYGNKTRASIIFFDELEGLKNKYMQRFNFINIFSRERTDADINYGRIDENKLSALSHLVPFGSFDDIYICGPEQMIFASENFLKEKGIDKSRIHFELFTTPGQTFAAGKNNVAADDAGPKSKISIKVDGRSVDFDLGFDTESILDAALKNGADLPFACKGGVCCTCRAKLVEGEVRMDVNYALEPEEVEQGFILTCQSHPVTDKVVIDFDEK